MTPPHIEKAAREMFLFGVHDPKRPLRSMDREQIAEQWDRDEAIRDYWITRATLVWPLARAHTIEEAAETAKLAALRTKKKRTKTLRLLRDPLPHEYGNEIAAAIRALAVEG